VSRSGYYKWLKTADEPDKDLGDYLLIKEVFDKGKGKLGFRSIQMKLTGNKGIHFNHKKIIRLKRKYGLYTKIRRINPYRMIMKKTLEHTTFPNLLDRQFKQKEPHHALSTDITYLPFNHRMAYMSVIKDIATSEVLGWNVSMHIDMKLVLDTLTHMKGYLKETIPNFNGIMIHSDQGFHYTNPRYVKCVREMGMIQSMSRKGNCIDNAPIESFFGHFKDEVDYRSCKTIHELRQVINDLVSNF